MNEYYKDLSYVQNHPFYAHVDIMTITGFMNDEQKRKHIVSCVSSLYPVQRIIEIENKYK